MNFLPDQRTIPWIERVALLIAVTYLGLHTVPRAWTKLNTDFPNYYLTARLAHEGYDTSRVYEWVWLQREKDHRSLDIPAVGMIPITPFSTLVMWPLTALPALTAKHVWIIANLALLIPLCWFIHSLTGPSYRRIAMVLAFGIPLQRNLLFGQFYILLLVLIVAACWCYVKEHYVLSGALIAVAAACKIFPVLLVVLYLRRRNWRALTAFAVTGAGTAALSIAVFGWNMHRTYLYQVIPWALHGEAMPPYVPSAASISGLLHYLLLSEPQWNPHPWHNSPFMYSLLQPALQMLLLAPAILLIERSDRTPERIILEWIGLLTASLAISTIPASYNFVLMVFPVCVLAALLIERGMNRWLVALIVAYLGIGFPMPVPRHPIGPAILFFTPRLFLMAAILAGVYFLLWRNPRNQVAPLDWSRYAWASFMLAAVLLNVHSTLQREQTVRQEFAYRVPLDTQFLLNGSPVAGGSAMNYVVGSENGYRLVTGGTTIWIDPSPDDDLSFSAGPRQALVEKARTGLSEIADPLDPGKTIVEDGRNPMLSIDGQDLAFVRADHGRGRLMVLQSFHNGHSTEAALTPPSINVSEASFISQRDFAISGTKDGRPSQIYLTDRNHQNTPLDLGESRYPALSPDEHWMAYSHLEHGVWNLWILDRQTGATRRVADVPCNQIEPSWEADSKNVVYANDCGRSLWFTAIARRRVIP
ncbi:MAG: glycosyltransferase 87 family protein [Terracidiphilus sp.]